MLNGQLKGCLCELQLLLHLLLLRLLSRSFAAGPLLLRTLVLSTATTPLLPRWCRGGLLLLLEFGVLWCFALNCTDLVGLLVFLLFPFTSQGSSGPCHVDGSTDLIEGGSLRFPGGVFCLHNDLRDGIKGGGNLGKEDEGLDVVCDGIGRILHLGEQVFYLLDGWLWVPQVGE